MTPKVPSAWLVRQRWLSLSTPRDKSRGTVSRAPQAAGFNPRGRSNSPSASSQPTTPAPSLAEKPPPLLRPLRESHAEAIGRWYAKAVVLAGAPVPLSYLLNSTGRRRTLALTDGTRQEPVGLMAVAVDDPGPGWATVVLLAIATQEQRDLAGQAVALFEKAVRSEARHIRAAVPADVGLALYFWLRLGYRPATPDRLTAGEYFRMARDLEQ